MPHASPAKPALPKTYLTSEENMKKRLALATIVFAFILAFSSTAKSQLPPGTETVVRKLAPIIVKNVAAPVLKLAAKAAWETTKFTVRNSFRGSKFLIKKAVAAL